MGQDGAEGDAGGGAGEDAQVARASGAIVVCLDDDALVEPVFLGACRRAGVHGIFTPDLARFQRLVGERCPDVVLLDQVMPDGTGTEVILWLRQVGCRPRIIAIGSDPLYVESAAALVRGGGLDLAGAIRKPLQVDRLADTIRAAVIPRA